MGMIDVNSTLPPARVKRLASPHSYSALLPIKTFDHWLVLFDSIPKFVNRS